jgi:predicted CXXCH cytochrome family protein
MLAAGLLLGLAAGGCATIFGPRQVKVEFTPFPESQVVGVRNPHAYQGKPLCQRCHVRGTSQLTSGAISLCVACHAFGHSNHPVDVVQKNPAHPKDLPLLDGGRVACHTCHDPHDLKARRAGLRAPFTELCLRCHVRHEGSAPKPAVPPKPKT